MEVLGKAGLDPHKPYLKIAVEKFTPWCTTGSYQKSGKAVVEAYDFHTPSVETHLAYLVFYL